MKLDNNLPTSICSNKKFEKALLAQSWRIDSADLEKIGANFGVKLKIETNFGHICMTTKKINF